MTKKEIFVFGDSLSDTGNSFAVTKGLIPPPPYYEGRFSNGKVAVEYLAEQLGSDYVLEQANNFAFGGATTGRENSNEDDLGTDLPGLRDQIDSFEAAIGDGQADPQGLYLVWAGPNDFLDTIGGSKLADPAVLLQQGTQNLVYAATTLANLGAEDIIFPNMLNLGRLPATQAFQTEATAISKAFNASIALAVGNLNFDVTHVDLFEVGEQVAADPERFGFSNSTDPLLPLLFSPEPPLNPEEFFFWDRFHPTTQGHAVLGNAIYETMTGAIAQPSFNPIAGTRKSDLLLGTLDKDTIDGFAGDDLLSGLDGDDQLEGWGGSDQLFGNQGNDVLHGGNHADNILGGQGEDIAFGGSGNDIIFGQADDDILIGDNGNDLLNGGDGDDYILGGKGHDILTGNDGADILNGGLGKDRVYGGDGNDRLDGGADNDRLTGNDGKDQFIYRPEGGKDVVRDFVIGTDQINLASFGFSDFADFTNSVSLGDRTIDFGDNNTLKLLNVDVASLSEADLIFA